MTGQSPVGSFNLVSLVSTEDPGFGYMRLKPSMTEQYFTGGPKNISGRLSYNDARPTSCVTPRGEISASLLLQLAEAAMISIGAQFM